MSGSQKWLSTRLFRKLVTVSSEAKIDIFAFQNFSKKVLFSTFYSFFELKLRRWIAAADASAAKNHRKSTVTVAITVRAKQTRMSARNRDWTGLDFNFKPANESENEKFWKKIAEKPIEPPIDRRRSKFGRNRFFGKLEKTGEKSDSEFWRNFESDNFGGATFNRARTWFAK